MTNLVKLSDVVTLMRNGTTTEQNQEGVGFPVSRIETISDGTIDMRRVRHVSLNDDNLDKWKLQTGDILFSHINSEEHIGKTALYRGSPEILIHGMNLLLLRPDTSRIVPEFLHFALRSTPVRAHVRARCKRAVNQASINQKEIGSVTMPLLPLDEQRRIVDLLSRAEGIVRLRREAQKKAAEIIPALFLDMFGDPATNPKGWPRVVLEEVAAVGSGNGFPIIHQGKKSGRFPFYKVSDMNLPGNEVEMRRANNYIDENDLQTLRARVFRPGTLIFPKIGAAIATNKKRVLTIEACFDNNVMGITPSKRLSSTFLHGLFLWKDISDFASDSNPPSIRKTTVETWEIQLPPNELQEQFAQRVSAIRSAQTLQAAATEQAKGTFNSLLSQVFSEDRNSACTHEDEVTA